DLDPTGIAVEDVGHRQDRFERIALRSSGRRYVGFSGRHPYRKIEQGLDGLGRNTRAVILDDHLALAHGHREDASWTDAKPSTCADSTGLWTDGRIETWELRARAAVMCKPRHT